MDQYMFVDISNLAKRAFHSPAIVMTPDGLPGTLIPQVFRMLKKLKEPYSGVQVVCIFDGLKATNLIREHLFPNYKENRRHTNPETPVEKLISKHFFMVLEELFLNLNFLGIQCLKSDFLEADLLIAAQVSRSPTRLTVFPPNKESFVVSSDVDYSTMIRRGVWWLRPTQKKKIKGLLIKYNSKTFLNEFGVPPVLFPFVKILQGDKSDGVSGVHGFGPVKSVKKILELFSQFDSKPTKKQLFESLCQDMNLDRREAKKKSLLFDLGDPTWLLDYLISKIPDNVERGAFFRNIEPEKSFKRLRSFCIQHKAKLHESDYASLARCFEIPVTS